MRLMHLCVTKKEAVMATQVKPIPTGYHSVTPMLTVREADKAIDFYKRALGAEEQTRFIGPDGKSIMHAELKIGNSIIMLGGEHAEQGCLGPQSLGGTPVSLYLYVEDADKAFHRATSAGVGNLVRATHTISSRRSPISRERKYENRSSWYRHGG